jgi:hypothetical protein
MSLDCPVFTADVSGLSSFDCFFCLRSVYCVSVSSVYCWCLSIVQFWLPLLSSSCILCECVQCLLLMSLDCPVLIASSVFVLYLVWVCTVFTVDISRLSSFYCLFCLRPVSCVSVSSVYCWCKLDNPETSALSTGQSRDISSKHCTIQRHQQ